MKHWRYILALGAIFGVSFVAWAGQVPNPVNADNAIVAGHFLLGNGAQRATDSGWSLVPMANGGCNAALTATANNLLYSTSSACALLPTANNGVLTTNGSGTLNWSTTLPAGTLPLPTTSTLGGIEAITCASHLWIDAIPTTLTQPTCAQPGAADLSNGVTGTGAVALASAPMIANLALSGTVSGSNSIPLGILAQQTTKCVLGNGSASTANVTCAWTAANTTDTVIPLAHGSLTTGDNVCLNDAVGTLKDCGNAFSSNPPTEGPNAYQSSTYYIAPKAGSFVTGSALAASQLYCVPYRVSAAVIFHALSIDVTTGSSGLADLGIYADNSGVPTGGALIADEGTVSTTSTGTVATTAVVAASINAGQLVWFCLVSNATPILEVRSNVLDGIMGDASMTSAYQGFRAAQTYGSLPGTFPSGGAFVSTAFVSIGAQK